MGLSNNQAAIVGTIRATLENQLSSEPKNQICMRYYLGVETPKTKIESRNQVARNVPTPTTSMSHRTLTVSSLRIMESKNQRRAISKILDTKRTIRKTNKTTSPKVGQIWLIKQARKILPMKDQEQQSRNRDKNKDPTQQTTPSQDNPVLMIKLKLFPTI